MKIRCAKSVFSEAVQIARRGVSGKSTLPILSNVLLEAEGESLRLSATDLELGIKSVVPAEVEVSGSLAIPAQLLTEVTSNLPDAMISLEDQDSRLILTCQKSEYVMLCLPAEEFPLIPELSNAVELSLDQAQLKKVIHQTVFAASHEDTRPVLTGGLLSISSKELVMVATDTHRLAVKTLPLDQGIEGSIRVIVPARALTELARLLKDTVEGKVKMLISENQVQFDVDHVTVVSRVVDGQFPNYEKVIPKQMDRRVVAESQDLLRAVKRAAIVARQDAKKIVVSLQDALLTITAESAEVGNAHEEVPVSLEGEAMAIAFNAEYLLDILGVIETEKVVLELTGALNPAVIKPLDDPTYEYVLMPMQI